MVNVFALISILYYKWSGFCLWINASEIKKTITTRSLELWHAFSWMKWVGQRLINLSKYFYPTSNPFKNRKKKFYSVQLPCVCAVICDIITSLHNVVLCNKNGMNKSKMKSSSYTASSLKMIRVLGQSRLLNIHFMNQVSIPFNKNLKEMITKVIDI